jgi:tetratricopeptide (TPR) repeat protein
MLPKALWPYRLFIGFAVLSLLGNPARSQQASAPAVPTAASGAKSYVDYGVANGAKGDLATAIKAFDEAIEINPKYPPAYYNRGFAYSLENKVDDADADFNRAIQLDPKYKDAYFERGNIEGQRDDLDAALRDFREVIKLDPRYAPAYHNAAHASYFKGDLNDALAEINQALTLTPDASYGYFTRGLIRQAQEHREEAASDFQKSAGLNFPYAAFWVWITNMENGHPDLARQTLLRSLAAPLAFRPGDWPSQIGNLLLGKLSPDQLVARAKTIDPSGVHGSLCEAWFYSGMVKRLSGDLKGARVCFSNAIATGSRNTDEFVEANREAARLPAP